MLLVSQNLLQMESKISAPETDLFAFSSKVVTLTFPVAYVILPAPSLLVFSPHPFLSGPQDPSAVLSAFLKSRINDNQRLKVKLKTRQRLIYRTVGLKVS